MQREVEPIIEALRTRPAFKDWDIETIRAGFESENEMLRNLPLPPLGATRQETIPTPDGDLPVLVQVPPLPGPLPTIVFFHGGGFALGGPEAHANLTASLAVASGAVVASVDYRLAPEHPYPAAHDDAWAALQWAAENVDGLGGVAGRIALVGDSAGGALSMATALRAVREGGPEVSAVVSLYGWLVVPLGTPSMSELGVDDVILPQALLEVLRDMYTQGDAEVTKELDLRRADLTGMPPTCLIVGSADPLRSDSEEVAAAIRDAGADAELHVFAGMPHGFMQMPVTDTQRAIDLAGGFLRTRLSG